MSVADFGDPVAGVDDVVLCVYDAGASPQPRAEVLAPARGTCSLEPCWTLPRANLLKFKDTVGLPLGMQKITAREREPDHGSIKVKAKGYALGVPTLPLTPPVRAQLQSRTGACWDAVYSVPRKNDVAKFNAKSD